MACIETLDRFNEQSTFYIMAADLGTCINCGLKTTIYITQNDVAHFTRELCKDCTFQGLGVLGYIPIEVCSDTE